MSNQSAALASFYNRPAGTLAGEGPARALAGNVGGAGARSRRFLPRATVLLCPVRTQRAWWPRHAKGALRGMTGSAGFQRPR